MDVKEFLSIFETHLTNILSDDALISPLSEAMRYSVLGGGKRLRPAAVFLGAAAFTDNADTDKLLRLGSAVELIHAYSLVHDDLPAMDDDDFRRGKPTVHKKYGESNAILTGDRLLTAAMRILIDGSASDAVFADAAQKIAKAAEDMADGQFYDLKGMESADDFLIMYRMKTAAMFEGAFLAGGIVGGASESELEILDEYAVHFGLAFQIADDLADIGKENSYADVAGVDIAKARFSRERAEATDCAAKLRGGKLLSEFGFSVFNGKN